MIVTNQTKKVLGIALMIPAVVTFFVLSGLVSYHIFLRAPLMLLAAVVILLGIAGNILWSQAKNPRGEK